MLVFEELLLDHESRLQCGQLAVAELHSLFLAVLPLLLADLVRPEVGQERRFHPAMGAELKDLDAKYIVSPGKRPYRIRREQACGCRVMDIGRERGWRISEANVRL